MQPGIMPGARLSKEEVNYRPLEKCGLCMFYYQAGRCEQVDGNISPDAICSKFALKPPDSPYRDKAFYQKEFDRTKGV
jgi:hypothetical protein